LDGSSSIALPIALTRMQTTSTSAKVVQSKGHTTVDTANYGKIFRIARLDTLVLTAMGRLTRQSRTPPKQSAIAAHPWESAAIAMTLPAKKES
jgi:hypothetical protein